MDDKKRNKLIAGVVLVVVLVALGLYVIFNAASGTGGEYRNQEYGISFNYPENWKLKEYQFEGKLFAIALDPEKVMTDEEISQVDAPAGLVMFTFEAKEEGGVGMSWVYELPQVTAVNIGAEEKIDARFIEETTNEEAPSPAYANKHALTYFVHRAETEKPDFALGYIADKESEPYREDFNNVVKSIALF